MTPKGKPSHVQHQDTVFPTATPVLTPLEPPSPGLGPQPRILRRPLSSVSALDPGSPGDSPPRPASAGSHLPRPLVLLGVFSSNDERRAVHTANNKNQSESRVRNQSARRIRFRVTPTNQESAFDMVHWMCSISAPDASLSLQREHPVVRSAREFQIEHTQQLAWGSVSQ